ncbi:hypothetical protein [Paenibacillus hexagrammi]|uniref:Uncharacterized protein n=1 Tax=Paenibacillus hexagrammi TaxID=2908839 RepID=A0ABY3SIH8_9BACL|nr:hypothetical protein [Paenibacillus sp. YPD9-1]UJF33818.1 hypothetical protein L0M14_00680 [Paenibacillus sp. YPD9-1]
MIMTIPAKIATKNLEDLLRDEYCCEYGQVFAERAGGLTILNEDATAEKQEPVGEEHSKAEHIEYLHRIGLQEEYLL